MKKKKYNIILVLLALVFGTPCVNDAKAQIFITEDDEEFSDRVLSSEGFSVPMFPPHDDAQDHSFSPLGNGLWLLGALGGAYLLGKRRKKKEE